jgi:uncharacterized Zn finger protein
MTLSQVLSTQVSTRSRSRGQAYFKSAAVRSLTFEHEIVQTTVRGSGIYTVWIERGGTKLHTSCTCAYFLDQLEICREPRRSIMRTTRRP